MGAAKYSQSPPQAPPAIPKHVRQTSSNVHQNTVTRRLHPLRFALKPFDLRLAQDVLVSASCSDSWS
jgi:hypothetical protein